jgi:hypothetical protein
MAQYCIHCKWYSADGLTHCSTCGAPFETDYDDEEEEAEVEERSLFERAGWWLALAAGALVGGSVVYRRYGTPENLGAANSAIDRASEAVKTAIGTFYAWIIGPNGEYKDFVVIALLGTAFIWLVLWVLARLGRR